MSEAERPCIRGCGIQGEHFAVCPWYPKPEPAPVAEGEEPPKVELPEGPPCRGCVPRPARDGALICERDYRALSRLLDDAPDIVGHLRSRADPMKAAVYDRIMVSSSRPELPAPVAADLLDASDDIMRLLRAWALYVQFPGQGWRAAGLEAGIDTADAYEDAHGCVEVILADLDRIVNTVEVVNLCDGVIVQHSGSPDVWTIADAIARYPLDDRPRWATSPCPKCDILTVRVSPPRRRGGRTRYLCTTCEWEADSNDDGGLWRDVFADDVPAASIPLGDPDLTAAHDARWLTLTEAAKRVGRTTGTVRAWVMAGELTAELGRYWQDDVDAVAVRRGIYLTVEVGQ